MIETPDRDRIDKEGNEEKIHSIIKKISEKTEIKEEDIDDLIDEINKEIEGTQGFKDYIKNKILKNYTIDKNQIEVDFEKEINNGEKPEIEEIKLTLEGNISEIYKTLFSNDTVDKKSTNIIKELIINTIILEIYEKKFNEEKATLKYRVNKTIRRITSAIRK